jgi:hypothetical protein
MELASAGGVAVGTIDCYLVLINSKQPCDWFLQFTGTYYERGCAAPIGGTYIRAAIYWSRSHCSRTSTTINGRICPGLLQMTAQT